MGIFQLWSCNTWIGLVGNGEMEFGDKVWRIKSLQNFIIPCCALVVILGERGRWCNAMIGPTVCGEANCKDEMWFCVFDVIFWDVWVVVVGFGDEVNVANVVAFWVRNGMFVVVVFWWEYVGSELRKCVLLVSKTSY